jgi:putative membrane protein
MMYWTDGSWGWGGWLLMIVSMALFWGLLIWVGLALVRSSDGVRRLPSGTDRSSPEELLAARYARGEIDDDEYERRNHLLREQRAHAG